MPDRTIILALSPRAAVLIRNTLADMRQPPFWADPRPANQVEILQAAINEIDDQLAPEPMAVTVISAEGVTTGVLNADDSITVPAPEPAAKKVARKMAKAARAAAGDEAA